MPEGNKVSQILVELEAIEDLIKPYEWYSSDITQALEAIDLIKKDLRASQEFDMSRILEWVQEGERRVDYYRGNETAEAARGHLLRMRKIAEGT